MNIRIKSVSYFPPFIFTVLFEDLFLFFNYVSVCSCMHMRLKVLRGQKRVLDPLELELEELCVPDTGARSETWVLYMHSICS